MLVGSIFSFFFHDVFGRNVPQEYQKPTLNGKGSFKYNVDTKCTIDINACVYAEHCAKQSCTVIFLSKKGEQSYCQLVRQSREIINIALSNHLLD